MRRISSRYCISTAICTAVWCTKMIQFCRKKNDTCTSVCKQIPGRRDHRSDTSLPIMCVWAFCHTAVYQNRSPLKNTRRPVNHYGGRTITWWSHVKHDTYWETNVPSSNSVQSVIAGFYVKKPSVPRSRVFLEKLTSLMKQQSVITHWYIEGRKNMTDTSIIDKHQHMHFFTFTLY